jgi:hypothetical protein
MPHLSRRSGTSWVDLSHLRRRSGSGWVDLSFLRRRSGSSWIDIWPLETQAVHTFTTTLGDAYRLPGTFGTGWRNNNIVYHGGTSNLHKGLWFYGNISALGPGAGSTRTASFARIRIRSLDSWTGTRSIVFRLHNYQTRPAGEPSYQNVGTITYELSAQSWTWITIPNGWANALMSGTHRGIGAYTGTGSQYAELDASANLEITYVY